MASGKRMRLGAAGLLRRAGALAAAAALVLGLASARAASPSRCDYTGFDQPCKVNGGDYRVLIPEGDGPFPVMVYLYGSGGHAVTITTHPLFMQAVVDRGYALVVPTALDMDYRGGVRDTGWSLRAEPTHVRDEVAFLTTVLDDIGRRFPIDRGRVLLAGQSRGAFLVWELACHHPEFGAAFAAHAGGYLGHLPERCKKPVRFLDSHGSSDPIVPIGGAEVFSGGAYLPPVADSLAMLARTDGCKAPAEPKPFYDFVRQSWEGCAAGSSLDLLMHPGGHNMPFVWFRAVLDWFEETPAAPEVSGPVARAVGAARPAQLFKSLSAEGGSSPFKGVPAKGAARLPGQ